MSNDTAFDRTDEGLTFATRHNLRGVAIAAILAVVMQFIVIMVESQWKAGRQQESIAIYALFDALDSYYVKNGQFPKSEAELRSRYQHDGFLAATRDILNIEYGAKLAEGNQHGLAVSLRTGQGSMSRNDRSKIVEACMKRLRIRQAGGNP